MATGSKTLVSLALTVAVAAVVVAAAGTVIAGRVKGTDDRPTATASRKTLLWSPGACVRTSGSRFDLVPCNMGDSEVVAMAADPPGLGGCPESTDEVLRVGQGRTACTRNVLDPHPGAPGQGGGVLRAGDCLGLDGRERPCSHPGWYGKAVAIAADRASCPRDTLDALALGDAVACLGKGGQVLAEGACVARLPGDEVTRSAIDRVECGSRRAWARVTSFAPKAERCPQGSDHYLRPTGACLHLLGR